ncbi:MAG: response regulator transcription factor [Planctomycetes bacterium]|nr:response regulator transcription factor [Planctomycetota bacterium]
MQACVKDAKRKRPNRAWGQLPSRMRVLFITGTLRTGNWLADAFAADAACDVTLDKAIGIAAGAARLRDETYDAVLLSHEGEQLDALDLLHVVRTGSRDDLPVVVLGSPSEEEMAALCYEAGGDAYICVHTTTVRTLLWKMALARERHELIAENRRLEQGQLQRLQLEHDEANRLLGQQRDMLRDLEHMRREPGAMVPDSGEDALPLPEQLVAHYRELLRTYVIMGSGNLGVEMHQLAGLLTQACVAPRQVMRLHLAVLEEMVQGLGNRSARHVMNRADILILEMTTHLAEAYREAHLSRSRPPEQMRLPGF